MQFRKSIIPPFCCPALQTGPGLDIILMYPGMLPAFRKIRWGGSWFILNFDMSILFFLTELAGTVAFSISGAILAIERELDLFGVIFLGAVTAIGGGVVRDLLLGQIPPQAFLNYIYLLTAVLTALLVLLLSWLKCRQGKPIRFINDAILNFFDAAGLGIFSVIGVQNTINAGFGSNAFFCVFLGMTTGVGGGMLRDVLSRSTPAVLRKHVYALASLAGALCYYWLQSLFPSGAIIISTLLVIVLRLLASHYRWTLPRISP